MINTLNESSLHKMLKTVYSLEKNAQTEVKVGQWICDIVDSKGDVIEIQTANVSNLKVKIEGLLSLGRKVTVVHPVIRCKTIKTLDEDGNIISERKSPKKETIYSIFRQLTGIYQLLLNKCFSLEIPEITIEECRKKTVKPVQLQNKSRRFLRNWIKTNKKLTGILTTHHMNTADGYLNLIPQYKAGTIAVKNDLTVKETAAYIREACSASASQFTSYMFWIFKRMNLIEEIYKKGNEHHYKIDESYLK